MNNSVFVGNLTKDPTLRKVNVGGNEVSVCDFNIAAHDGFGDNKKTAFVRCTAWRGTADAVAQYLKKGSGVGVAGAVYLNEYFSPTDGTKHAGLTMRPTTIEFIGSGKKLVNETGDGDEDYCPFEE